MSDEFEQTTVETDTTEAVADPSEVNATTETTDQPSTAAELEAIKRRLAKAEFTAYKVQRENKELKRQTVETSQVDASPVDLLRKEMADDYLDDIIERSSSSPEEREQIREEYEHSIAKSGITKAAIREDVAKAIRLVRSESNEKVAKELSVTVKSKSSITNSGGSSNQERPEIKEDWRRYLNSDDLEFMRRNNWNEEKMRKAALAIKAERGLR